MLKKIINPFAYLILTLLTVLLFQNCSGDFNQNVLKNSNTNNISDRNNIPSDEDSDSAPITKASDFCKSQTQEVKNLIVSSSNKIEVSPNTNNPDTVIVNNQQTTLRAVTENAPPNTAIVLKPGYYSVPQASNGSYTGIFITSDKVVLSSSTGNPNDVVIDSNYRNHGGQTATLTISGKNVTIHGVTLKRSVYHLVHLINKGWGEPSHADDTHIHNVKLIDGGQQFLKASSGSGNKLDRGRVTCNEFLMTDEGRKNVWGYGSSGTSCYTGGIDTHSANDWVVSNNTFTGIYCDSTTNRPAHRVDNSGGYYGGLAEDAIHMWDSDQGSSHLIEQNIIVNCARGIRLGLNSNERHYGGVIRNNTIYSEFAGSSEHDTGIQVANGQNTKVYNNTVIMSHSSAYSNAIETRFNLTNNVEVFNNLTNQRIRNRDSNDSTFFNNYEDAKLNWFKNYLLGDLSLSSCNISEVKNMGAQLSNLSYDINGDPMPSNLSSPAPDLGADQCLKQ